MAHQKIASLLVAFGLVSGGAQAHTVHEFMNDTSNVPGETIEARAGYVHEMVHDFLADLLNSKKETNAFSEAKAEPTTTNVSEILTGQVMDENMANALCADGDGNGIPGGGNETPTANTPIPGAAWLLGSGLLGITAVARRKSKQAKG